MSDATRCATCGGEFSSKRVHIQGKQFHPGCAVMSHPTHTADDYARLSERFYKLREAMQRIDRECYEGDPVKNIARSALTDAE